MDDRFIARLREGEKMAPLCREFGISRVTGYKIFNRCKLCGLDALDDRSRRPLRPKAPSPRPPTSSSSRSVSTGSSGFTTARALRPAPLRLDELRVQHLVQTDRIVRVRGLLQPPQSGGTGQGRRARRCRLQPGVGAQGLVVVEIFVGQRQRVQTLPHHRCQLVQTARLAARTVQRAR